MMDINRDLKDRSMNRIDHALGRPLDPMKESYRDYYATNADSDTARQMVGSHHWKLGATISGTTFFQVTAAGREALRDHLREIGDKNRAWRVWFEGREDNPVIATTRDKARYKYFLSLSDCYNITFGEFCKRVRVKRWVDQEARADG